MMSASYVWLDKSYCIKWVKGLHLITTSTCIQQSVRENAWQIHQTWMGMILPDCLNIDMVWADVMAVTFIHKNVTVPGRHLSIPHNASYIWVKMQSCLDFVSDRPCAGTRLEPSGGNYYRIWIQSGWSRPVLLFYLQMFTNCIFNLSHLLRKMW